MKTDPELEAAADRRRRQATTPWGESHPYSMWTSCGWELNEQRLHADNDQLAGAYLAEHRADDGEPITADWFEAVGFERGICGDRLYTRFAATKRFAISLRICGVYPVHHAPVDTRGDVRRICAAHKVPLPRDR